MRNKDFYKGLIIVWPHGDLIKNNIKTTIIKSKKFDSIIGKPLLLIQKKEALGIIYLDKIKEIDLNTFNTRRHQHQITEAERKKWWPDKKILYEYTIGKKNIFSAPMQIQYPRGPQVIINKNNIKPRQHINIGTSGYDYSWWRQYYAKQGTGTSSLSTSHDKLKLYSHHLNSLEINGSYYKIYDRSVWIKLNSYVDSKFVFSVKVNRSITLFRNLLNLRLFWNRVKYLTKLKCLLFQFSKNFKYSDKNIKFLKKIYLPIKSAFEFRDKSWFNDDVFKFFKTKKNWSIVISYIHGDDWPDYNLDNGFNPRLSEWIPTSNFIYVRMHGSTGRYTGSHKKNIPELIKFIRASSLKYAFVYFNNTDSIMDNNIPDAVSDAIYMQKKIGF